MVNIKFVDRDREAVHYAFVSTNNGKGRKTVYRIDSDDNSFYTTDAEYVFPLIEHASTQKAAEDILDYFEKMSLNDGMSVGGYESIDALYEDIDGQNMILPEDEFVFVELCRRAKEAKAKREKAAEHVYCTNCKHFKCEQGEDSFGEFDMVSCEHEDECNLFNFEDSMPFSERPMYEEK